MDDDGWSFGAFWVLLTKDSCSAAMDGLDDLMAMDGLTVMEGSTTTATAMNLMAMERLTAMAMAIEGLMAMAMATAIE